MDGLTPMMKQYFEIKEQHKDSILFFRLGDFYEMFFEDAIIASKELEITLTGRDCGLEERAPMCGVPFHSADSYILRLIDKGFKVAICEQVEEVGVSKGPVKRDVVKIVTPGTVSDPSMLDEKKNNYLMSIYEQGLCFGLAVADVSTGEFLSTSIIYGNTINKLFDEIAKFMPSEIIVSQDYNDEKFITAIKTRFNSYISFVEDKYFKESFAKEKIKTTFHEDLDKMNEPEMKASGCLIEYLEQTQKNDLRHIKNINLYKVEEFMLIDMSTRRNLELTETMREKSKKGSLLWVLDKTLTSMGGRTIKKWIEQPLINSNDIQDRLDSVGELKDKFMVRVEIRELLKKVYDMERLAGKIVLGNVNCRDLISLKNSIAQIPYIKSVLHSCTEAINDHVYKNLDELTDVFEIIDTAIIEDPPITIKEGGIIKTGFDTEVDKLRKAGSEGKRWIAELEARERAQTGIKNLKVGFNKVFGYYIEVTKSNYSLVPSNYIRKQTLANCERYITQELKDIEDTILGAEVKIVELEYKIFTEIKNKIESQIDRLKSTSRYLAQLDVIASLAEIADRENYEKPQITSNGVIDIKDGRHPVVEKMIGKDSFVPNDTILSLENDRISIITGPNMAGKSTYMRQVALIVLMAQIGSFVPARTAEIGVVDRIFTRVGASDDLGAGQSTFMVEMSEVANIVLNATNKSLLILDEIGRGTSTFDGLSIAWSVVEFISNKKTIGSRTLFATHYHELTELEGKIDGVTNYCIAVKKEGEDITFLRKIIKGGADESYGIEVARLAGIPKEIIIRAKEILKELENADVTKFERKLKKNKIPLAGQMDLFSLESINNKDNEIVQKLKDINVTNLTPVEALNILYDLQKKANKM